MLPGIAALYTAAEFEALARDTGLGGETVWVDGPQRMALFWVAAV